MRLIFMSIMGELKDLAAANPARKDLQDLLKLGPDKKETTKLEGKAVKAMADLKKALGKPKIKAAEKKEDTPK